eukprot:154467_1
MDNNPKDWYLEIPGRATAITNAISNDQTTVQHNVWQCKITLNMTQLYKIIGIEISEATANYNQIQRVCEANKDEEGWTPDNIRIMIQPEAGDMVKAARARIEFLYPECD